MKLFLIAVASFCSPLLEGKESVPTITIENVRPYGYIGDERSVVVDVRIHNGTERSFWFVGQGPDSPFHAVRNRIGAEWRTAVLCGTGARTYELTPGKALSFVVVSCRDSLAVQVALGSTVESIGNLRISSEDLVIYRSQLDFSRIDGRRYLPPVMGILLMLGIGMYVWRLGGLRRVTKTAMSEQDAPPNP